MFIDAYGYSEDAYYIGDYRSRYRIRLLKEDDTVDASNRWYTPDSRIKSGEKQLKAQGERCGRGPAYPNY